MSDRSELNKAIVAHGGWKIRLKDAIDTGKSEITPEKAASDGDCAFGKWLNSLPVGDRSTDYYKRIAPLHSQFHQEAAKILRLALAGNRREATAAMTDIKSNFVVTSAALINVITEWKSNC